MHEPIDIEAVTAEALRKLGRNIVNFSKIEAAFKHLLSISQFEGTETTISNQLHRKQTNLRKQSLGKLVQKFNEDILGDTSQPEPITDFSEEISLSLRVTCSNSDFLKTRRRILRNLVAERNKLIHQELALLDTTSVEDYRKLIVYLDEQNPRLLAHLEELKWIIESLRSSLQAFEAFFNSPDFLQHIQSDKTDT